MRFVSFSGLLLLLGISPLAFGQEAKPNVLIIMADDCTHNDLPAYGGQNAQTPHIDRLAKEGLTFNRAYVSSAMCQPCRAELFTGQHPVKNGSSWNHSASKPEATSIAQHLGRLGYRVGLSGKVHVQPAKVFAFESVAGFDPNCVRSPTRPHSTGPIKEFMERDPQQPFCLVVALVEPHVPWVMGDASAYPPEQLKLPPNLADTEVTREAFSRYLAEITYMDSQVGEILEALNASGQRKNTLVLFTSEQGAQFPGCKWTNWDTGLHTALIAHWPGRVPGGKRTEAIVQYADVAPTLIDLAGGDPQGHDYDGRSFLSVLTNPELPHRRYAYGIHNNVPEGPPYPIRSVTDGEYRYIRNLTPDEIYIEKHLMGLSGAGTLNNPYWGTWMFDTNNPRTERLVKRYMKRPAEQLYHTASDRYEMKNLAGDPQHAEIQAELSRELDRWMKTQGDPGQPLDTYESLEASRKGEHRY
jgi:N-sulfoglucosamine sulfohydrolase